MKAWILAFVIAQGADMATTHVGISRGCVERNPLLPRSVPALYAVKGAAVFGITLGALHGANRGRSKSSKWILAAGSAAGFGAAAWNLHKIPGCGL